MKILIAALVFLMFLFSCSPNANLNTGKRYDGHPIIGSWSYESGGCIETYEFTPDGTRHVTSGQEIVKAAYTISNNESGRGFYKLTDEVLEDNGKADCSGSTADMTGDIVELYIAFSPSKNQFFFCFDESFESCMGPFTRN